MSAKLTIGFLGAGKMATALARGFIRAGLVTAGEVIASDPSEAARAAFGKEVGAKTTVSNPEVAKFAEVLVLAVKPDQVGGVLADVRDHLTGKHCLISIAAGVPLAKLEAGLESGARLIRVMPNTPALVGASASAYALGKSALLEDGELAHKLLSAVGVSFQVKESLLDAVTGLSGSGPAYVYLFIEGLSDGGVAAGLPREIATRLAAQTLAFAQAPPQDPRVPEALHLVVRATRYGCTGDQTGDFSHRALDLLHRRYPAAEWAGKTPYWFR